MSSSAGQIATPSQAMSTNTTSLLKEFKALVGQGVKLSLDDGHDLVGLLWSYDTAMGVAALEVPKDAATILNERRGQKAVASYQSKAAATPTAITSSLKVAAQGGDASGARTTFELIKLRRIQRIKRLQNGDTVLLAGSTSNLTVDQAFFNAISPSNITQVKRDINVAAAEAREKAATAEAMKRAAKIGVGVSGIGQQVFDALSKTLPCRWADRHIIVMDEFVISPDNYNSVSVPNVPTSTLQAVARGEKIANAPADIGSQATRWQRVTKVLEGERKRLLASS